MKMPRNDAFTPGGSALIGPRIGRTLVASISTPVSPTMDNGSDSETSTSAAKPRSASFRPEDVTAKYQMNMRYPGQNFSLTFDLQMNKGMRDLSFIDEGIRERALAAFNATSRSEFGTVAKY